MSNDQGKSFFCYFLRILDKTIRGLRLMNKGRDYKRIKTSYVAKFQVRSDEAQEMESDDWDLVTLHNLSAGGALFFYKKDLGIGTLLNLKINVPKSSLIIKCVGKVIRIDKPRFTSMICIAIKFIDVGEQEKEMINTTIVESLVLENLTI